MTDQTIEFRTSTRDEFDPVTRSVVGLVPAGLTGPLESPVRLMNVLLDPLTQSRCIQEIVRGLREGRGGWVITLNLDHVRRCWTDPVYEACVREADLRVADGMPLIWASRLQRSPLPERIAGSDLIFELPKALAADRRRLFLLGGDPGTAEAAGEVLVGRYPGLVLAGTYCPPMGFEREPAEWERISSLMVSTRPDVVLVALGSPKQEYLIRQLRHLLPGAWWMGVGISFSFACGQIRRAPGWMQRYGLEWVHRMVQEPGRLLKRYVVQGLPFAGFLLLGAVLRRSAPRSDGSNQAVTNFSVRER